MVSADERNNFTSIQTQFNALLGVLDDGVAGDVLGGVGTTLLFAKPPGYEFDHATKTTDVSVTGTTSGSPTSVVAGSSVSYDGSPVWITVSCYSMWSGTAKIQIGVYKDGSLLNKVAESDVAGSSVPGGTFRCRDTPAAGAHTYSVSAWVDAGTGKIWASSAEPVHLAVAKV